MRYFIFKYLWLIVILPKAVQFCCFGMIALLMAYHTRTMTKIRNDSVNGTFLLTNILFLFSMILAIILKEHETDRIFAAINTCAITFIAVMLYNSYSRLILNYYKISKYMCINFIILFIVWLIFIIVGDQAPLIFGRGLCGNEWFNGTLALRFNAYLEYVNLVVYMILYTFPLSLYYASKKLHEIFFIMYMVLPVFITISTHSRSGIPVVILMSFVVLGTRYFNRIYSFVINNKTLICVFLGMMVISVIIIFNTQLENVISIVLKSRQGSTNTRSLLYTLSINQMLKESPFIGLGIKDMWNSYPLGSHSTYLGMFYKTGIIGGSLFLCGFAVMSIKIFMKKVYDKYNFALKISYFGILLLSVLEDLDGADWNIVLFLIFISIINRKGINGYD